MIHRVSVKAITLFLTFILVLSGAGCTILPSDGLSGLEDIDLSKMELIYHGNAPIISVDEPVADEGSLASDGRSYTACTVRISSNGRRLSYGHYTYVAASAKIIMIFGEREYEIIVELDKFGCAEEKAYTVKLKEPLSIGDIASGRVTEKTYAGYASRDPVPHNYPPEEERETLVAYENDPCLEHVCWRAACVDCGYVTSDLQKTKPLGHDLDDSNVCIRCKKSRQEIEEELEPSVTEAETTDEESTSSEPSDEQLDYLRVISSWAGNASIACQPSAFGEERTEILQLSDLSLVNYIVLESSNELVVEVDRTRTVDVDRGIIEIPYTVMSYGEAVVTVYIHHDDADGVGDIMKLTLKIIVSPIR